MTTCYEGNLGHGKTMNAVHDLKRRIRRGVRVLTNTPIEFCDSGQAFTNERGNHHFMGICPFKKDHFSADFYKDPEQWYWEMLHMKKGTIFIDEAGIVFNKKFSHVPLVGVIKLIQSRKEDIDFAYTAQSYMMLDGMFRMITNWVYQCNKYSYVPFTGAIPFYSLKNKKWVSVSTMIYTRRRVNPILCIKRYSTGKRGTGWQYVHETRKLYPRQYIPTFNSYDTKYIINMMPIGYKKERFQFKAEKSFYDEDLNRPSPALINQANMDLIEKAERAIRGN